MRKISWRNVLERRDDLVGKEVVFVDGSLTCVGPLRGIVGDGGVARDQHPDEAYPSERPGVHEGRRVHPMLRAGKRGKRALAVHAGGVQCRARCERNQGLAQELGATALLVPRSGGRHREGEDGLPQDGEGKRIAADD